MALIQLSPVPRKFLNQKNAAAYCGYGIATFKEYVEKYNIPRRGPDNRKYCVEDLDAFMAEPLTFCVPQTVTYSRTPKVVTV
ncbi:DNA-binding protein [Oleidesulfovibrio alaskensis]